MNVTNRLLSRALRDALDLIPRISEDDPMAPALADWCRNTRELLRIIERAEEVAAPVSAADLASGPSGGLVVFK